MLEDLDLSRHLAKDDYKRHLKALQIDLIRLQQSVMREGLRAMVALEGMDAAGKGGAIRRMAHSMDPRAYRVYRVGPPERQEKARHHLYRFWTKVPLPGEMAVFDRSWYGRVLVERVEGLEEPAVWERGYREINDFERTLADSGVVLVKCWLHIDPDEQLRRFNRRLADPLKAWKMSEDDWRNRENWDAYMAAVEDMFAQTYSEWAPWTVIPANDKRYARIRVLQAVSDGLRRRAERDGLECPDPEPVRIE
ncbi:polyphosphate kinase 2 family protein [Thiohalorhabdus methylotrophus]|uniref:Polyphosphate kinase 2 family protein n=1 Tax=Thiohalorhabdus methylotrophus TaxID=3242694 RepID=A0ABV4TXU9_9GAMM